MPTCAHLRSGDQKQIGSSSHAAAVLGSNVGKQVASGGSAQSRGHLLYGRDAMPSTVSLKKVVCAPEMKLAEAKAGSISTYSSRFSDPGGGGSSERPPVGYCCGAPARGASSGAAHSEYLARAHVVSGGA